jgi:hypothetical protein
MCLCYDVLYGIPIYVWERLCIYRSEVIFICTGADSLGLEVQNVVDISDQVNCELAMRISSSIKSGDDFYTDLNGLQVCYIYLCTL